MGTRGCVGWVIEKDYTETSCDYDAYPEYLGVLMLVAVKELNLDSFKEKLSAIIPVNGDTRVSEEHKELYKKYSSESSEYYSTLFKDVQGYKLLKEINKGNIHHYPFEPNMMSKSFDCQFAFTLNFVESSLEFWRSKCSSKGYGACKLYGSISFDDIKTSTNLMDLVKRMIKIFKVRVEKEDLEQIVFENEDLWTKL